MVLSISWYIPSLVCPLYELISNVFVHILIDSAYLDRFYDLSVIWSYILYFVHILINFPLYELISNVLSIAWYIPSLVCPLYDLISNGFVHILIYSIVGLPFIWSYIKCFCPYPDIFNRWPTFTCIWSYTQCLCPYPDIFHRWSALYMILYPKLLSIYRYIPSIWSISKGLSISWYITSLVCPLYGLISNVFVHISIYSIYMVFYPRVCPYPDIFHHWSVLYIVLYPMCLSISKYFLSSVVF